MKEAVVNEYQSMLRILITALTAASLSSSFAQDKEQTVPIKDAVKINDIFKMPEPPKMPELPKVAEPVKEPAAIRVEAEPPVKASKVIAPGMNKQAVADKMNNNGVKNIEYGKISTISTDAPIVVTFDRAEIMPIPKGITTLILGNPLIADAAVQPNGFMVITAKGNGTTNMIALDSKGNTIFNRLIRVKQMKENVVQVYRGDNRETLTCAPSCNRTPTIGDAPEYFDASLNQSVSRSGTLSGAAGRATAN